jgi:hypothetical protein
MTSPIYSVDELRHVSRQAKSIADTPPTEECIPWPGHEASDGYGRAHVEKADGRKTGMGAHRLVYLLATGDIPHHFQIDHLCRNPLCCNPFHLEAVPARQNVARSTNQASFSARSRLETGLCPSGHDDWRKDPRCTDGYWCHTCNLDRHRVARRNNARIRAAAAASLGMTLRAYISQYGARVAVAKAILSAPSLSRAS